MSCARAAEGATTLDRQRVRAAAGACRFAERILWYRSIDSTNEQARRLGRSGAPHGTVVVADEQTRGRGRQRRVWESPAGGGLYCSVLLRGGAPIAEYAVAVQLAAGVAVAETLAGWVQEPIELLWPNDCLCRGQKIAGVLVEAETTSERLDFLVCGIGVNLDQDRRRLSPQIARLATSLACWCPRPPAREEVLARLLVALEAWEGVASNSGLAAIVARFQELSPSARGARP